MLYKPDWEEAKRRLEAWWDGETIDRPVVQITAKRKGVSPVSRWNVWTTTHFLDVPEYVVDEFEKYCKETYFGGEAIPNLWINIGPGIMAAYIGAVPRISEDTVWFETPKGWDEIEKMEFDSENEWWRKTCRITSVSAERGKGKFFTGFTDIGCNLDIAASLRGSQRLILDLVDSPDRVKELAGKIDKLWFKYYSGIYDIIKRNMEGTSAWMGIWSPKRWYPLQCDFSAMLSPKMFEEFVLPYLDEECRWLDHSIYHWDGPGQIPHLDMLLEIKELNGIQWTPGDGAEPISSPKWFPYYRKVLKKGKNLVLLGVRPEKVEELIRELGPERILINTCCDTEDEAKSLLKRVSILN